MPSTTPVTWRNALEPRALVEQFIAHPPEGFSCGLSGAGTPWFLAQFDLLTTLDEPLRRRLRATRLHRLIGHWLRWRTVFVGATVSEYLPAPAGLAADRLLADLWVGDAGRLRRRHPLLIIKDIPTESPLLPAVDVAAARALVASLQLAGYVLIEGQALAWVPIDFDSMDGYLARLSYQRRKNIRRKLRSRAQLDIECLATGDAALSDAGMRGQLYALYLQVYAQSEIHFDRLTQAFFDAAWQDAGSAGRLFIYREGERIVGWNMCYQVGESLVDKFIGLDYVRAHALNLYVVSWMHNLDYARRSGLRQYVAGWTDPQVKAQLGARFTFTRHAAYPRSPVLRWLLRRMAGVFEGDRSWHAQHDR